MSSFLTQKIIEKLDEINDLMLNGQWTDAVNAFQKLNCSANEYFQYLETVKNKELQNFCKLGFYAKTFKKEENAESGNKKI